MPNYNKSLLLKEAAKIGSLPADTPLPKMKGWKPYKGEKFMIDDIGEIEDAILEKTAEIWNMFVALEQTHPSDIDDLGGAIHDIQKIISIRIARRLEPDKFVTIKDKMRK